MIEASVEQVIRTLRIDDNIQRIKKFSSREGL